MLMVIMKNKRKLLYFWE